MLTAFVFFVSLAVPVSASETGIEVDYNTLYVSGSYVLRVPASSVAQTGSTDIGGTNITYYNATIDEDEDAEYSLIISHAPTKDSVEYVAIAVLVKADTVETIGAVAKSAGGYTTAIPCETSTVACTDSDKLGYMMVTAIAPWDGFSEIEFTISGQLGAGNNSFTMYVSNLSVSSYSGLIPDYIDESTALMQSILTELETVNTNLATANTTLGAIKSYLLNIRAVVSNMYNLLTDWFQTQLQAIATWGQAIIDAINGDKTSGNEFKEDSEALNEELGGISSGMDSMEVPDQSDIQLDAGGYISGDGATALGPVLSTVLGTGNIGTIFTMSIMLMTAAYILYGKR